MSSYQFTPQAVEDLFEIWSYIAGDDPKKGCRLAKACATRQVYSVQGADAVI